MLVDDDVAVLPRDAAQRQVAVVQIAHRRHERHAPGGREELREFGGVVYDFHAILAKRRVTIRRRD